LRQADAGEFATEAEVAAAVASVKIVWTKLAITDLDNAYDYIAATNPSAALDIIEKRLER